MRGHERCKDSNLPIFDPGLPIQSRSEQANSTEAQLAQVYSPRDVCEPTAVASHVSEVTMSTE